MDIKKYSNAGAKTATLASEQIEQSLNDGQDTLTAFSKSLEDEFDNGPLIQTIEDSGYSRSSKFEHLGVEHSLYFNKVTDTAIIFTDSLSIPGNSSSQGATAIIPYGNRLIPALMIPAPSAETFTRKVLSQSSHATSAEAFEYYMNYCSTEGQIEIYLHESVHLSQILEGTPWGLTVAAQMTYQMLDSYRQQGFELEVSPTLIKALERGQPSEDEMIAALLVQEIKAHAINIDSGPERAQAAMQVAAMLKEHITPPIDTERSLPQVRQTLEAWGRFISQWPNYPEPTAASLDIGARWIIEAKTL